MTLLWSAAAVAGANEGKAIFESKNCGSCHITSGPVDALPPNERSSIKGPPLWFAGDKFKEEWLTAWLAEPNPIRRVNFGTLDRRTDGHAVLSQAEAPEVAAYLGSLTDPALKQGIVSALKLNRRKQFQGENLFTKKQVCFGCHMFPSRQGNIGGFTGPSLLGAGERLNIDWVVGFFADPTRYYPSGRMPVYANEAFDPYTAQELELLMQYITNM